MNIALLGYGKMGKELERIALERNHEIILIIDEQSFTGDDIAKLKTADVALEFSVPSAAYNNITTCFDAGVPVVSARTSTLRRTPVPGSASKQQTGLPRRLPGHKEGIV